MLESICWGEKRGWFQSCNCSLLWTVNRVGPFASLPHNLPEALALLPVACCWAWGDAKAHSGSGSFSSPDSSWLESPSSAIHDRHPKPSSEESCDNRRPFSVGTWLHPSTWYIFWGLTCHKIINREKSEPCSLFWPWGWLLGWLHTFQSFTTHAGSVPWLNFLFIYPSLYTELIE